MTASYDPRTAVLLAHKGSPIPLEPPRLGIFHDATIDPSRQHQGSLTGRLLPDNEPPRRPYDTGPIPWPQRPLWPLYTEKLPTSPAFKTKAELAQRRRDFWMKIVARGGIAMMVAAPVVTVWKGAGMIPAGAFVAGLIVFAATCFYSACRNRTRLL